MQPRFELIQDLAELEQVCHLLNSQAPIAVDLEADSLHHYSPKVCLVQISTNRETFLVDPLIIGTLTPLGPLLQSKQILKVFHGGDYDLRSLFRDYSIVVTNVFDTMIASQFVGDREPGLAAVIERRFGITLDKKFQKADWSKRPLSKAMLAYAAHDTAHLLTLQEQLKKELAAMGRLAWVEEESQRLSVECTREPPVRSPVSSSSGALQGNTLLFRRFRGAGTMSRRDLAVLENILEFREREAFRQDKPPFKIFGNSLIKKLVDTKPSDRPSLEALPRVPRSFLKRYGEPVLAAIRQGLDLSDDRLPSYPSSPRPAHNPEKQSRLKKLKRWRQKTAARLKLPPGLICNNVLLDLLAQARPTTMSDLKKIPDIRRWQRDEFGADIVQLLKNGDVPSAGTKKFRKER